MISEKSDSTQEISRNDNGLKWSEDDTMDDDDDDEINDDEYDDDSHHFNDTINETVQNVVKVDGNGKIYK